MRDSFVLEIAWNRPGLPDLVGPFGSEDEARQWARLNVTNGTAKVRPLAYPYAQPVVHS